MNIVLPPKRFQDPADPCFDSIRHHKWFRKLDSRRKKVHILKCAYRDYSDEQLDMTQKELCFHWGIDPREFRDYVAFRERSEVVYGAEPSHQAILDCAYQSYCGHIATKSIRHFIEVIAPLYGVNPRHIVERWETDPMFLPTGYK